MVLFQNCYFCFCVFLAKMCCFMFVKINLCCFLFFFFFVNDMVLFQNCYFCFCVFLAKMCCFMSVKINLCCFLLFFLLNTNEFYFIKHSKNKHLYNVKINELFHVTV